jgi:hypothetical protein
MLLVGTSAMSVYKSLNRTYSMKTKLLVLVYSGLIQVAK